MYIGGDTLVHFSYLGSVAIRLGQKVIRFLNKWITSGEIVGDVRIIMIRSAGLSWIHHQVPIPILGLGLVWC